MKNLLSIFIAILIWFSSAPVEWLHQLLEEHEEVHFCDYDTCVRSFSHECQLDQSALTKKPVLIESETFFINSFSGLTYFIITTHIPEKQENNFNPRGPPFFLI